MKKLMLMIFSLFLVSGIAFAQQDEKKIKVGLDVILTKDGKIIDESHDLVKSVSNRSFLLEKENFISYSSYIKAENKNSKENFEIIKDSNRYGEYLNIKPIILDENNIEIEYSLRVVNLMSLDNLEVNGVNVQVTKDLEEMFSDKIRAKFNESKILEFKGKKNNYTLKIIIVYKDN